MRQQWVLHCHLPVCLYEWKHFEIDIINDIYGDYSVRWSISWGRSWNGTTFMIPFVIKLFSNYTEYFWQFICIQNERIFWMCFCHDFDLSWYLVNNRQIIKTIYNALWNRQQPSKNIVHWEGNHEELWHPHIFSFVSVHPNMIMSKPKANWCNSFQLQSMLSSHRQLNSFGEIFSSRVSLMEPESGLSEEPPSYSLLHNTNYRQISEEWKLEKD